MKKRKLLESMPLRVMAALLLVIVSLGTLPACGGSGNWSAPTAEDSVIFIGASTVQYWPTYVDFPSRHWTAKGREGETSADVLARFDRDVIAPPRPYAVHILCGINDMGVTGYNLDQLVANWTEMITKAKNAGIKVYIGTLQPWGPGPLANATRNNNVLIANARLKTLGASLGVTVIDYHSVLAASDGLFISQYTDDGVHPNRAGYLEMTKLTDAVIGPVGQRN